MTPAQIVESATNKRCKLFGLMAELFGQLHRSLDACTTKEQQKEIGKVLSAKFRLIMDWYDKEP